jgi:hypothetical protein
MPPVTVGALQLYVVPAGITPFTPSVGVALNCTPLHVVAVIAAIVAFGFTVTVIANAAPVQLPDNGVTVYVAVCDTFVGLVNVPVTLAAPAPVVPPVSPPVTIGALQLYVVPAGTIPFVPFTGELVNNTPLHVVAVIALIAGVGFTVTVNVNVAFEPHNGLDGVII